MGEQRGHARRVERRARRLVKEVAASSHGKAVVFDSAQVWGQLRAV